MVTGFYVGSFSIAIIEVVYTIYLNRFYDNMTCESTTIIRKIKGNDKYPSEADRAYIDRIPIDGKKQFDQQLCETQKS